MSAGDSVSVWIEEVKKGDEEAAQKLWDAYFPDLIGVARRHLRSLPRRVADEEDVALSALNCFFNAAEQDRFPDLAGRDSLWRLLSRITQRKAVSLIRRTLSQKQGGGDVRGESVLASNQSSLNDGLAGVAVEELTPELTAIMIENFRHLLDGLADECRRLLEGLGDEQLQAIALAKMEGYTNDEIAAKLDIALRTVERRVSLIRSKWQREPVLQREAPRN